MSLHMAGDYGRAVLLFFAFGILLHGQRQAAEKLFRSLFWLIAIIGYAQFATNTHIGNLGAFFGEKEITTVYFGTHSRRLLGTTSHPNAYAQLLVICYVFVAVNVYARKRLSVLFLLFGFTLFLVSLTISRGGLLFFFVCNGILFLSDLSGRSLKYKYAVALIALFSVLATLPLTQTETGRFMLLRWSGAGTDSGALESERTELLGISATLLETPKVALFGTGLGAFFAEAERQGLPGTTTQRYWLDLTATDVSVHNILLLWLVELGVVAGGLLVAWYFVSVYKAVRSVAIRSLLNPFSIIVVASIVPAMVYMSTGRAPLLFLFGLIFLYSNHIYESRKKAAQEKVGEDGDSDDSDGGLGG